MGFVLDLRTRFAYWRLSRLSRRQRKILYRIGRVQDQLDGLRLQAAARKYRSERRGR